ncbi:porin [Vibrio sp. S12_S33]|uniref:porin n=1 Tax=Vibrio sp. S12_S33 TaxID=2720223 RepID=UPI00177C2985|nr:porin [Vibrio sp. S12_S33]
MNRTALSLSIACALSTTPTVFAADNGPAPQPMGGNILTQTLDFGGHVGTSIEYEDKDITTYQTYGGKTENERTTTHEVLGLFYKNAHWNFSSLYAFKLTERVKRNQDRSYVETEDGYKHLISIDKKFPLPNGFETGVIYDLEYSLGTIVNTGGTNNLRTKSAEHSVRPYFNFYSNEYDAGFQSNLEYLYNDEDRSAWGTRVEEGYSVLVKPYKRFGNWELGLELFYQVKDNDDRSAAGAINEISDFTEKYVEPIVQYSFEDAGTLYVRARYGENETKLTQGWDAGEQYFKDIRKATMGYEQSVGDNWLLKGEYEWAKDTETFTKFAGEEKVVEQNTFFVQAIYRL